MQVGLDKETKTKLFENKQFPSNCPLLEGPKNNPEVQVLISQAENKKDGFLMDLQNQLGKGIAALGTAITNLLATQNSEAEPNPVLTDLVEAGKMLCTVHHSMTTHRKYLLSTNFSTKIQKIATAQARDTMLFGDDFGEKCKSAKNLETVARELKPSTSYPKNLKGYASKSRWKQTESRGGRRTNFNNKPSYKTSQRGQYNRKDKTIKNREWHKHR